MRWQGVSLQTEGTYPHPGAHIDLAGTESALELAACGTCALPEGVEDGLARRFARDRVILEKRSVGLLLQWRIESTDGDNEPRGFLQDRSAFCMLAMRLLSGVCESPYHAGAGQGVPTQANTVCILDLTPLVLECLEVCHAVRCLRGGGGGGVWAVSRGGERGRPQFDSEGSRMRKRAMDGFGVYQAINSAAAARTGCNNTTELQGVLSRSSQDRWLLVTSDLATAVQPFRALLR